MASVEWKRVWLLAWDELSTKRTIVSYILATAAMLAVMAALFSSSMLQIVILFAYNGEPGVSYYYYITEPLLRYLLPFLAVALTCDCISQDIRSGRARMLASSMSRDEYIIAKLVSGFLIVEALALVCILFAGAWSMAAVGSASAAASAWLFLNTTLVMLIAVSCVVLLSLLLQSPFVPCITLLLLSMAASAIKPASMLGLEGYIMSAYAGTGPTITLISASAIVIFTAMLAFRVKQL